MNRYKQCAQAVVCFLTSISLYSKIVDIVEIEDTVPHLKEMLKEQRLPENKTCGILFMTDLDETVFFSDLYEATSAYFDKELKKQTSAGIPIESAVSSILPKHLAAHRVTPITRVDPDVNRLITLLKEKKAQVIALTARSREFIYLTYEELAEVGIDLIPSNTRWNTCFPIFGLPKLAYYTPGILFCCGQDKGKVLEKFLLQLSYQPLLIILVDDSLKNLNNVETVTGKLKIPFLGLHFTRYEQLPPEKLKAAKEHGVPEL